MYIPYDNSNLCFFLLALELFPQICLATMCQTPSLIFLQLLKSPYICFLLFLGFVLRNTARG